MDDEMKNIVAILENMLTLTKAGIIEGSNLDGYDQYLLKDLVELYDKYY